LKVKPKKAEKFVHCVIFGVYSPAGTPYIPPRCRRNRGLQTSAKRRFSKSRFSTA